MIDMGFRPEQPFGRDGISYTNIEAYITFSETFEEAVKAAMFHVLNATEEYFVTCITE